MKKQNLFLLAFAAISLNNINARPAQSQRMNNSATEPIAKNRSASTSSMKKKNNKKEGFFGDLIGGKKEQEKVSSSSGVKAKRTEKHKFISKKNVKNMKEEDVFAVIDSELMSGKVYQAEYIANLETLTRVDEEIKQTVASTSAIYNLSKKNKKKNEKIVKSKSSSMEEIAAAKIQLDAIKKHESAMKDAGDMRKRLAEKTEGVKKNYIQVKKNLKALSSRCGDNQKAKIQAFLSFNPTQAAQEKLRAHRKEMQERKAATRQAKICRREERLNKKHGGEAQVAAYKGGMQKFVEEKKVIDKQMKDFRNNALKQASKAFNKSPEFKNLSAEEKNKKMSEIRKKTQMQVQKDANYRNLQAKKQAMDKKIAEYRQAK